MKKRRLRDQFQNLFSFQWMPWQWVPIEVKLPDGNIPDFPDRIALTLNRESDEPKTIEALKRIEWNVTGYLQTRHVWTKRFIKKTISDLTAIVEAYRRLHQSLDVFRDENLLSLLRNELMILDKKGIHPLGGNQYVDSERYLEAVEGRLFASLSFFRGMLSRVESTFPETLRGNDQTSEKELLSLLIYELIYIYECCVNRFHAEGPARSQDDINEFRIYFVGTVLYNYGIDEQRSKPLSNILENKNLPIPKTAENRLAGMIQTAFHQYQQNCQPPA